MEVEGLGTGKDVTLHPGGGRAWDRAKTGTRHSPGIQPAGVGELPARGAVTVVLCLGVTRQLRVRPAARRYLEQRSITVRTAETREAVEICNELAEGALVAGLFRSPC